MLELCVKWNLLASSTEANSELPSFSSCNIRGFVVDTMRAFPVHVSGFVAAFLRERLERPYVSHGLNWTQAFLCKITEHCFGVSSNCK